MGIVSVYGYMYIDVCIVVSTGELKQVQKVRQIVEDDKIERKDFSMGMKGLFS